MDIRRLRSFFMWCTILDGSLLLVWTLAWTFAPDRLYELQHWWFPLSKETFTVAMYGFLGLFKLMFLMFNVVPFIALCIVGRK